LGSKILEVDKITYYPNGYINIDQHGNYTKHYYAETQRIASKIGSGYDDSISYNIDSLQIENSFETMKNELGIWLTGDTVDNITYLLDTVTHLIGDGNIENALFFYHGNNMSSTMLITDYNGDISQAVMYMPNGVIISEYNQYWLMDTLPKFYFQGKQWDEELKMYYFHARYYDPNWGIFTSRDAKFEKYYWCSPYAMTLNNWLKYIDPDGQEIKGAFINAAGNVELNKASRSTRKVFEAMSKSATGTSQFKKMVESSTKIRFEITGRRLSGGDHGETIGDKNDNGTYDVVTIIISTAKTGTKKSPDRFDNATKEEMINAIGVHESIHTLDPAQIKLDHAVKDFSWEAERNPIEMEYTSRTEYNKGDNSKFKDAYENPNPKSRVDDDGKTKPSYNLIKKEDYEIDN